MTATMKSKALADEFTPVDRGGAKFFEKTKEYLKKVAIWPATYSLGVGITTVAITGDVALGASCAAKGFVAAYIYELICKKVSETKFGKKHGCTTTSEDMLKLLKKLKRTNNK